MRRIALFLSLALVAAFSTAPMGAASTVLRRLDPGVGGFMSPNLEYVATLATDSPGVGARIVTVNGQRRFYVSSIQGLRVYDITNPGLPVPIGALELPHWENEDITVSRDGKTILMSEFTGTYMHVIQATDLPGGALALAPVGFTAGPSGHIVDCIDDDCDWVYGSEGVIIDLRDKADPIIRDENWAQMNGLPTSGHNLHFDNTGLLWTDTSPISALDVSDPLKPVAVVKGNRNQQNNTAYQHNNIRPNAALFSERVTADEMAAPGLRPGELLMGNGETNFTGTCNSGSGPFATYKIKTMAPGNTDALQKVDVFRPVSGQYANGDPAVNALGCSGHWFSVQPSNLVAAGAAAPASYLVAAAWYEHGTRLLSVDAASGKITQKGYFQPVVGSASAAHWIDNQYIYVVDYMRGVDILRYKAGAPTPTVSQFDASWLSKAYATDPLAERQRYLCRLVTQD